MVYLINLVYINKKRKRYKITITNKQWTSLHNNNKPTTLLSIQVNNNLTTHNNNRSLIHTSAHS